MAFRLRMPAEIGDWLAGFAGSEPEASAEVGAALLALMAASSIPGVPLVIDPDEPGPGLADPREVHDHRYQRLLEELQEVLRELADASQERDRTARLLAAADPGTPLRTHLERRLDAAQQLEAALSRRGHVAQRYADVFRTYKETAKAVATAEDARLRIQEALQAAGFAADDGTQQSDTDLAAGNAAARLAAAEAEAFRVLGIDSSGQRAPARPEADVVELRPDPLGSDTRILFAEEPTGTITLLAVLEDEAAVDEHHYAALDLACQLLEEIRDDGWPAGGLGFDEPAAFIARFYPGRHDELTRRAARLGRTTLLARLRESAGLAAPAMTEHGGLSQDSVRIIDEYGARHADVADVAAYARALGGTLRLIVDLDGTEHIVL